jgi:hypothetical protein
MRAVYWRSLLGNAQTQAIQIGDRDAQSLIPSAFRASNRALPQAPAQPHHRG